MAGDSFSIRALQLGDRIELKGLERDDAFSKNPLAFRLSGGGMVALFKSGAAVFVDLSPVEEDEIIRSLGQRIVEPLAERESETVQVVVKPAEEDITSPSGAIQIKAADAERLLLVAEALAVSVALAHDERRIARAFERLEPVATSLAQSRLPPGPKSALLGQIGEALHIQQRLADRVGVDEKPDVLWDHPALERFWAKLVDEYDLAQRARAIERKLVIIRETADMITDLISTRTSHRLELYIIALIALEIALGVYDRFIK
ncbi:MAG: RMD1 family protein [Alphaproteobacteria bacterium]|nr:RMD1 family protein [Alphaproteobacteria bacterium]